MTKICFCVIYDENSSIFISYPFLLLFFLFALILSLLVFFSMIILLLLFLRVSYRKMYVFQLGEHATDKQA